MFLSNQFVLCFHHYSLNNYLCTIEKVNIGSLLVCFAFLNLKSNRSSLLSNVQYGWNQKSQFIAIYFLFTLFFNLVFSTNVLFFLSSFCKFWYLIGSLSGPVENVECKKAETDNREKRRLQENIFLCFLGQAWVWPLLLLPRLFCWHLLSYVICYMLYVILCSRISSQYLIFTYKPLLKRGENGLFPGKICVLPL